MAPSRLFQAYSGSNAPHDYPDPANSESSQAPVTRYSIWDAGESRNRVNTYSFADGRATMSVRSSWYLRHRLLAVGAPNSDLGKALYVTVALASDAVQHPFQGSLICPYSTDT
jgi:hypothetical protein